MDDAPLDPRDCVRHNARQIAFARSSRKHRIAYDDMRHAIVHGHQVAVRPVVESQRDERIMHLGPARDGTPLEIAVVLRPDGSMLVIHAMRMRAKFDRLYRIGEP